MDGVRKLIVALVAIALVLVGADVAGRLVVQHQAAQALAEQLPKGTDPSVRIGGFSFLLQAVPGDYTHITLRAADLPLGEVKASTVTAELSEVHLSPGDALSGKLDHLTVGRADLRAVIAASALGSALDQPGMTFSPGQGMAVRVHTTVAVDGRTFPVTADVVIAVADGALKLSARPVTAAGVTIPDPAARALQERLSTSLPLSALPFPLGSATVTVSDGDLVISAHATDLDAAQLRLTAGP